MARMGNSVIESGQYMGRARLAFSRSGTIGKVAQNGVIGTPLAVYGYGCVGQTCSPGTSVSVRTGVSTIGLIGCPVSRLNTYRKQFFPADATPLIVFPPTFTSKRIGPVARSQSHRSW